MTDDKRTTEQHSKDYEGLDQWDNQAILETLWFSQTRATACVKAALPDLSHAAEAAAGRLRKGGRLFYLGAGAAGHLAVQDALELTPTFGWPQERIVLLLAGGQKAFLNPMGGAEDDGTAAQVAMKEATLSSQDVVIAVSASGSTPFTLAGAEFAQRQGALVTAIANNAGCPLFDHADHTVYLDSGPEVIAGSTRLAAGTAQKAALNLLSTLTMARLGRVYDGHMVAMGINNAKLAERAVAMITEITGVSPTQAEKALEQSGMDIRPAVLIALGATTDQADRLLREADGNLRQALQELRRPKKA